MTVQFQSVAPPPCRTGGTIASSRLRPVKTVKGGGGVSGVGSLVRFEMLDWSREEENASISGRESPAVVMNPVMGPRGRRRHLQFFMG